MELHPFSFTFLLFYNNLVSVKGFNNLGCTKIFKGYKTIEIDELFMPYFPSRGMGCKFIKEQKILAWKDRWLSKMLIDLACLF